MYKSASLSAQPWIDPPNPNPQQPCEGLSSSQQPCEGLSSSQQPCEGLSSSQRPCEGLSSSQQPCEGSSSSQQPCEGSSSSQQPCEGSSSSQQPCEGLTSSQQPCEGSSSSQQPCQHGSKQETKVQNDLAFSHSHSNFLFCENWKKLWLLLPRCKSCVHGGGTARSFISFYNDLSQAKWGRRMDNIRHDVNKCGLEEGDAQDTRRWRSMVQDPDLAS